MTSDRLPHCRSEQGRLSIGADGHGPGHGQNLELSPWEIDGGCGLPESSEPRLAGDPYDRPPLLAAEAGVPESWLNDAVKGFLSPRGDFEPYLELPHLSAFVARPAYLLAMKCASMRLGAEFHDLDDVRYLLRYLNISTAAEALRVMTTYFDETHLLPKTRLVLEELLG